MNIVVGCQYEFIHELRYGAELDSVPLYSETVTDDVADLIEETYVRGVLSEILPLEIDTLQVAVQPIWQHEPVVAAIRISLAAFRNGSALTAVSQDFARGRWVRTANAVAIRKHEQGELAEGQAVQRVLLAMKRRNPPAVRLRPLAPPPFADQSLEACGVRPLGAGSLVADRPVLVNQRLAADAIRCCEQAGTTETGGAVLGKIVRLRDPLPQTTTRFATLLSMVVEDPRHVGAPLSFTFSLEGLAEAATFGDCGALAKPCRPHFTRTAGTGAAATAIRTLVARWRSAIPACRTISCWNPCSRASPRCCRSPAASWRPRPAPRAADSCMARWRNAAHFLAGVLRLTEP